MNNYRTSLYISVLLHFPLGKRENLPGGFPHVAKHADGQGKALLHLPAVTVHSTVSEPTSTSFPLHVGVTTV